MIVPNYSYIYCSFFFSIWKHFGVLKLPYIYKFSLITFMLSIDCPVCWNNRDNTLSGGPSANIKHQSLKHGLRWNILKVQERQSKSCLLTLTLLWEASKMPCSPQEDPEFKVIENTLLAASGFVCLFFKC